MAKRQTKLCPFEYTCKVHVIVKSPVIHFSKNVGLRVAFFSVHNPAFSIPNLLDNLAKNIHYTKTISHTRKTVSPGNSLFCGWGFAPLMIYISVIMLKVLKVLKTKGMIETLFVENSGIQVSKWR